MRNLADFRVIATLPLVLRHKVCGNIVSYLMRNLADFRVIATSTLVLRHKVCGNIVLYLVTHS
jgi:hypothetical protein